MKRLSWLLTACLFLFNACRPADKTGAEASPIDVTKDKKPNTEEMKPLSEISKQLMKMAASKPHFMTWDNFKETFSNLNPQDRS